MDGMRVSQLAERSGVPATTLRFYEQAGLLSADRTPAGYRVFGEDALERLAFIAAAKRLGLPLEEVGELLAVWAARACREVKADLRPRIAARAEEAGQRMAELAAFTATLRRALEHLDALPDRDGRCDPECGFVTGHGSRMVDVVLSPGGQDAPPVPEAWETAPVACSLTDAGRADRAADWRATLAGAASMPVPGGVRLTLPVERAATVAGLAAAEQECCPFFDFRLHLDGEALHLEVRAPADAADLLAELFGPPA